jgi:S1-C subfamily serine protease
MNTLDTQFGKRVTNASLAVLAAVLLVAGVSWGSLAAGAAGSETQAVAAQQVTPAARGLAAGRDSYADIVKVVAPAVVTIRVEGQARIAPTVMPDDDLFRRFFGDQGGRLAGAPGRGRVSGPRAATGNMGSARAWSSPRTATSCEPSRRGRRAGIRVDFTDGRTFNADDGSAAEQSGGHQDRRHQPAALALSNSDP